MEKMNSITMNNPNISAAKAVVEKWYKKLSFPSWYDAEFYAALDEVDLSDVTTLESYDKSCEDGKKNLFAYLYFCEETERLALARGISAEIITDTLSDLVTWTNTWTRVKGTLCLYELPWLSFHVGGRLFRLGRLQYCIGKADRDIPKYGVTRGDDLIEVHIPEGEKLTVETCEASLELAHAFFAKYFPELSYNVFTCHSWLLDDTLDAFLSPESGIRRFAGMFDRVDKDEAPSIIRYLFSWDTTPENLAERTPTSGFAARVQQAFLSGTTFYETLGVIPRK